MEATTTKSRASAPLMIAAAIAVIAFCAIGIAAIMGWIPSSLGGSSAPLASTATSSDTASNATSSPAYVSPIANPPPYATNTDNTTAPPPVAYNAPPPPDAAASAPAAAPAPAYQTCASCGTVESIREVAVRHRPTGIGLVGGALVGGLLGHAIGGGRGNVITTVGGAAGGAYVGNQIEKNHSSAAGYSVKVRLDDGSIHTLHYASLPNWREGDRVVYDHGHINAAS